MLLLCVGTGVLGDVQSVSTDNGECTSGSCVCDRNVAMAAFWNLDPATQRGSLWRLILEDILLSRI